MSPVGRVLDRVAESLRWRWSYFTELDHCPVNFPWFAYTKRRHPSDEMHLLAYARGPRQRWVKAALIVAWPLAAARRTTTLVRERGPDVKARHGVGLTRQWLGAMGLALRHNINADSFYMYELWGPEKARAHEYLQHHEILRIMPRVQEGLDEEVHDKVAFFRACTAADLPTAPILALFRPDGTIEWLAGRDGFPPLDLFLKPSDKWRSRGAERWRWAGDGQWERRGRRLDEAALIEHVRSVVDDSVVLVQPSQKNHPSVEPLTNGGLGTLRIVTCRVPGRPTVWLPAMWRMPTGESEVNQFAAGGIYAAVGDDGVLSAAVTSDAPDRLTHHPDTGAPIEGRTLPGFDEMAALAVRTHETLGGPYFVGWDMYYRPDGPAVLEGNPTWGVLLNQATHRRPLASQPRFYEGVAAALEHRSATTPGSWR